MLKNKPYKRKPLLMHQVLYFINKGLHISVKTPSNLTLKNTINYSSREEIKQVFDLRCNMQLLGYLA